MEPSPVSFSAAVRVVAAGTAWWSRATPRLTVAVVAPYPFPPSGITPVHGPGGPSRSSPLASARCSGSPAASLSWIAFWAADSCPDRSCLWGDPGIGKSTLLLQSARALAADCSVLYVSAEESAQQVKLRWRRLQQPAEGGPGEEGLQLLAETDLELVLQELEALRPAVAIIDSIQALHDAELNSAPGSVSQVRECAAALQRLAKRQDMALLLVGHVTKEGMLAGPKVLEHLVDAVLTFEGDRFASHRLLRAVKNRFGATHELGVFEMRDRGLAEVTNPSELFLGGRSLRRNRHDRGLRGHPPSSGRPAGPGQHHQLCQPPANRHRDRHQPPPPDPGRAGEAHGPSPLPLRLLPGRGRWAGGGGARRRSGGGRRRGGQLPRPDPAGRNGAGGGTGAGGQIRSVAQLELRLQEAARLGFRRAVVPRSSGLAPVAAALGLELLEAGGVAEALVAALGVDPSAD